MDCKYTSFKADSLLDDDHIEKLEDISATDFVLNIVKHGVTIPFVSEPCSFYIDIS